MSVPLHLIGSVRQWDDGQPSRIECIFGACNVLQCRVKCRKFLVLSPHGSPYSPSIAPIVERLSCVTTASLSHNVASSSTARKWSRVRIRSALVSRYNFTLTNSSRRGSRAARIVLLIVSPICLDGTRCVVPCLWEDSDLPAHRGALLPARLPARCCVCQPSRVTSHQPTARVPVPSHWRIFSRAR